MPSAEEASRFWDLGTHGRLQCYHFARLRVLPQAELTDVHEQNGQLNKSVAELSMQRTRESAALKHRIASLERRLHDAENADQLRAELDRVKAALEARNQAGAMGDRDRSVVAHAVRVAQGVLYKALEEERLETDRIIRRVRKSVAQALTNERGETDATFQVVNSAIERALVQASHTRVPGTRGCVRVCVCLSVCLSLCVCVYVCVRACVRVCVRACVCVRVSYASSLGCGWWQCIATARG